MNKENKLVLALKLGAISFKQYLEAFRKLEWWDSIDVEPIYIGGCV
jgi:hypothetical protein